MNFLAAPEVVLDGLPDALLISNNERLCVGANTAACTLVGLQRKEILARRIDELVDLPLDAVSVAWDDFRRLGTKRGRIGLKHVTGQIVDVDYHSRADVAPGVHVAVLRAHEEGRPSAKVSMFDLLAMQEQLLATDASLEAVMRLICERATRLSGAEGSTIEMRDGEDLVYRVCAGTTAPFTGVRVKQSASLSGLALNTRRVLVCHDSETDERVDREACRRVGARSMVVVPLVHEESVIGVLKVNSSQARAFDEQVVGLLRLLAGFLGSALTQAAARDARDAQLRAEKQHVQELERLRHELAACVVHDLRSPLAAVLGNLQYLRHQLPEGSQEAIEAAVDAIAATKRLDGLIQMFLEMARLEQRQFTLRRTAVDRAQLFREISSERARPAAEHGIALATRVEEGRTANVDVRLVRRLIDNIIDNAFRFTPAGGRVELEWNERNELRIGNTGVAIPPAAQGRIFEKFGQEDRSGHKNFGLGLYFCRLVAEAHDGRIWVESTPTLPAIFAVSFSGS